MENKRPPARAGRPGGVKAVSRRNRGVGSNPIVVIDKPGAPPPDNVWTRFRYRFDNALSRSAWVVIGYLGLVTLAIVLIAAVVTVVGQLFGFGGPDVEPLGALESFWQMLLRVVDAGSFAGDATWPTRLLALFVTLIGIFIAGSLIGLISSAVDQRIDALRRGRSHVLEKGHTLILGWSARVPSIVGELVVANESEKHAAIVILADIDKTQMEETIRASVGDMRTTNFVGRRGDPSRMSDLELVNVSRARSILIMSGEEGDSGAIKASLAVLGLGLKDVPIVVEMESAAQADTLEAVTGGELCTVNSDRVIAEVTAQACRERGLAVVFQEMLDFDGDELYFSEFPELVGATYEQARLAFEKAAVMGLATAEGVMLNPPPDRTLEAGDRVVALVADDSEFVLSAVREVPQVEIAEEPDPEPPQHILLVGWSSLAPRVMKELDEFLTPGSEITVLVDPSLASPKKTEVSKGLVNSKVEIRLMEGGPELLHEVLGESRYEQGILLGYREGIAAGDADARTLLTLMALRQRWPKGHPPEVRLVAEVLDQRNVPIAQVAGVDDFIVSDQLASLMLAQLSENVELRGVFDELFDAEGVALALRPAKRFAPDGSVTFGQIVAAGSHFNESPIGYRTASDGRVVLNPAKSVTIALRPEDEVVVLAHR